MGTFKINGELELNSYLTAATTLYVSSADNTSIIFKHGSTECIRINPSGCLNIGSTQTASTYKLYVAGKSWLSDTLYFNSTASYINASDYTGNAATATKATQDGNGAIISSTYLKLSGGTMTGTIVTPGNDSVVIKPAKNNYDQIGAADCKFWKIHASTFIGNLTGTASIASTLAESALETTDAADAFLAENTFKVAKVTAAATAINNDGMILSAGYSGGWGAQIWLDDGSGAASMRIRNRSSATAWNPWRQVLTENNYNSYAPTLTGTGASGTWGINVTGSAGSVAWGNVTGKPSSYTPSSHSHSNITYIDTRSDNQSPDTVVAGLSVHLKANGTDGISNGGSYHAVLNVKDWGDYSGGPYWQATVTANDNMYYRRSTSGTAWGSWRKVWAQGDSVTGAVWNDYAEYRESDCQEFGRVLMEKGDDSLTVTNERLSHFAGISSDTWGFSQGETEKAKTPIAVAGRVLAYPYQNRNNYKPGDCVCAAPGGTVDIMAREEIIKYPDRIVGTVSCVPDYEDWGGGDRPPVKVNGRIWIKIK